MVNPRTLVIAVLGLGEAGSVIARDLLAAGAEVRGYDPAVAAGPGITDTGSEAADLLIPLGPPLIADASRAVHGRLSAEQDPSGQRAERLR
jgi:6-phosphogluconate dehydrogenase (decarboxylating)